MATIEFPSGLKVRTFRAPPAGFDPLKADDETLIKHGFPRRPKKSESKHNKRWESIVGRPMKYVTPLFRRSEHIQHGVRKRRMVGGVETDSNWAGAVVYAPAGETFHWVQGEFTVPDPYPEAADGNWYYSSAWVGIDGDGSPDVFQAGVECEAVTSGGVTTHNIYPWWEWYPENEVAISNFPVAAGDTLTLLICVDSSTTGTLFFSNKSNGATTSFQFSAPTGTTLVGNCAEWIVEAPGINGQQSSIANYGMVFFDNATAGLTNGTTVDGGSGDSINMVDSSGTNVVSSGTIETPTLVKCSYV